jgi:hypothetical protein
MYRGRKSRYVDQRRMKREIRTRNADIRLLCKENSNSQGARPVHSNHFGDEVYPDYLFVNTELSLFRVQGLRFGVLTRNPKPLQTRNPKPPKRFRVSGSMFRVSGFRLRFSVFGFRVSGFGFWI